jgi:pyruvate,water dikinase
VLKLKCLLTEELADLENNVQGLLDRALERQTKPFLIIVENAVLRFANEAEANEIRGEINKQISSDVITGTVASRGNEKKYKALVKVLLSPKECDKVLEGDFLVATMTSPDYVIAMKKAIGFITDEGGVTCHAAIVARELKKPCIIGTKIATKILKDGDMVEIDIDSGVVRIIK